VSMMKQLSRIQLAFMVDLLCFLSKSWTG
jgi:hypothetical protein